MTSYRRTTFNVKQFIDMDTERIYIKNSESNHFQMEYQKPITTQVASYEFATGEWNKYASSRDVSMEDAWLESYRSEVNTLLEELDETQSMIRGCVDEIKAQRWIRDMEKKLEWESKITDELDENERRLEIEHQKDMEKLRQEHDRLLGLQECKLKSKMGYEVKVEDAMEEIIKIKDEIIAQRWIRDMEKRMEWERRRADELDEYERRLEIEHESEMEILMQEHDRLLELKECKLKSKMRCEEKVENAMEEIIKSKDEIIAQRWIRDMEKRLEWERRRADELDEYERRLEIEHHNEMEILRQEHDRLLQLKYCKRESKMEGNRANVEDAIDEITKVEDMPMMEEAIKSKHRENSSIGCFGFVRKLFKRRSKKTKRDGKSDD